MISPKRCAIAFLDRFVGLEASILGDLQEQSQHRSALWLWRQVLAIAGIHWFRLFFQGTNNMKRMAISMSVLLGVFVLGFWSGRTALFVQTEDPPRWTGRLPNAPPMPPFRVFGTTEFLQQELQSARERDAREKTSESRIQVQNLERKLAEAKRAMEVQRESAK